MNENRGFEQNNHSRTALLVYKNGHDSITLMKGLVYQDRSYHLKYNYYDLMPSVSSCLNEISKREIICRSKRQKILGLSK